MKKSIPLILIFVVLVVLWSVYGRIMNPKSEATAAYGEYKVEIDEYALLLRDEVPITVDGQGYFQNVVESETKVWAGETVGWFCKGDPDVDVIKQLNVINQKIREASAAESTDKALTNDIVSIDNKILNYTKQISALSAIGDQKAINKIRNEIDLLIERKNIISKNKSSSKEGIIENLTKQKKELEGKLGSARQTLTAPKSGIFVASADGLEKTLSVSSADSLTPDAVKEYLGRKEYKASDEIYPYPVCKITDNTQWLLAVVCSQQVAAEVAEGKKVTVSFPEEGDKTLGCRIYKKSEPKNGEVVIYIAGTNEIYNIFTARKIKISILIDSYEGLRIPAKAVKTVDGKDIVKVLKGGGELETPVTVLFKDEDFAIIKDGEKLEFYDKVKVD
ncbi:MAG: HlyD family efflux transporter periplasmic adaptor subunit [Monoglobales bacterium]